MCYTPNLRVRHNQLHQTTLPSPFAILETPSPIYCYLAVDELLTWETATAGPPSGSAFVSLLVSVPVPAAAPLSITFAAHWKSDTNWPAPPASPQSRLSSRLAVGKVSPAEGSRSRSSKELHYRLGCPSSRCSRSPRCCVPHPPSRSRSSPCSVSKA
jgi:hypothetical protein